MINLIIVRKEDLLTTVAKKKWIADNINKVRKYRRDWYERNKVRQISRQQIRRNETREWLNEIKEPLLCATCGENRVPCLEFHHTDPSEKDRNISETIARGWSRKRIELEISKCIILCCNCHRMLHFELKNNK